MSPRKTNVVFKCQKREVVGSRGVVASNSALASLAGVEVLARGGNAVDAAVATAFAQTVTEPSSTGIFGAGFAVYYQASSKQVYSIDHYAVSPKGVSPSMFTTDDKAGPMETVGMANKVGYLSVGVPEEVREGLRRKGYKVSVVEKVAGGMNGVMFGEDGMIRGGGVLADGWEHGGVQRRAGERGGRVLIKC
jgi:gamma-glutamyltranspeptidase